MSINTVCISGNLVRDAERRGNGPLAFTVAVNSRTKDASGEWADKPNYIDCVLFGKLGEAIQERLKKGEKVCVQGELRQNTWEKDGQKRSKTEVYVGNIEVSTRAEKSEYPSDEVPF